MPQTIMAAPCCCGGPQQMYIAYPCWNKSTRLFVMNGGSAETFIGSSTSTPLSGTLCRIVLIGAGGAGNGTDSGGAGAYVESQVTIPAASISARVGKGGPVDSSSGGAPFGGASGASSTRWGGGATGFRLGTTADFVAAGGGAAGSANFTGQTVESARGGDAGISVSARPATDITVAGGSTTANGGAGGVSGGGTGTLGNLPSPGSGGTGASGTSGGGGGGGGRAGGGGGGTRTVGATTYGGAGTGGSSLTNNIFLAHEGFSGYAQASPYTSKNEQRGLGDGGLNAGFNGRAVLEWRACTSCPCPDMPAGVPPALHICLTQTQLDNLLTAAGDNPCVPDPLNPQFIAFNYKNWPFYINPQGSQVVPPRPCSRVAASGDLSGGFWTSFSDYCCRVWQLPKAAPSTGLCTRRCDSGDCPEYIYMCDKYRRDLGLPPGPACTSEPGKCYFVQYQGCDYLYTSLSSNADCQSAGETVPRNVGTGWELKDCFPTTEPNEWEVGPNVFSGGLQLGDVCTITWDASAYPWCNSNFQACVPNVTPGPIPHVYRALCLYNTPIGDKSHPQCHGNHPKCGCVNGVVPPCDPTRASTSIGICTPAFGNPNPCDNPCNCPKRLVESNLRLVSAEPTGSFSLAMTVTRTCPADNTNWLSASGEGEVVIADGTSTLSSGCRFYGNGRVSSFAARINEVLGDRVTASASGNFWWGPRYRSLPPEDVCCGGAGAPGDEVQVVPVSTTVSQIYCRHSSAWNLESDWTGHGGEFNGPAGCTCSDIQACRAGATAYIGPTSVEVYGTPLPLASMGPLTWDNSLYDPMTGYGSFMSCGCGGAWTPPSTVTVT